MIITEKKRVKTMSIEERRSDDVINATISGPVSGQVAIGNGINQVNVVGWTGPQVTQADLDELHQAVAKVKAHVESVEAPDKKAAALERMDELEEAITAEKPDLTTLEYVKRWFARNLPELAGAVTGIIVHPIVGKLVEAAGDGLAAEFRRRFGRE
jgi:hypothetical protein